MAETSLFWPESGGGDGGRKYSDDEFSDFLNNFLNADRTTLAVIRGLGGELEVTGTTSPLDVANGWALVDGKPYQISSGPETVAVPTPGASTRIDRIVLEKDFTAQTVRLARVEGTEGGGAPAVTQTDGSTWQVSLAQVSITTGGAITVTDEREFVWTPLSLLYNLIQRDSPDDGDILVADAASDGGAKFVDRSRNVVLEPFQFRTDVAVEVGDDAARLPIPSDLDGYRLAYVRAKVKTAPSGGPVTVQIHNIDGAVDMLSTVLTIDSTETTSETAATPAVINTSNDDVADGDDLRIDVDTANGAVGLQVEMGFVPA